MVDPKGLRALFDLHDWRSPPNPCLLAFSFRKINSNPFERKVFGSDSPKGILGHSRKLSMGLFLLTQLLDMKTTILVHGQ